MTLSKSAENKDNASDYALFALRFFFSSSPNSQTLAQSLSTLSLPGLTDSQMQTRPSHKSYRYATLKFYFWYIGFPLLCLSDTDIITTNLIYAYSSFTSPSNWSWYSSIHIPLSTVTVPKQSFDSNGNASSTKLWHLQSTLQVLQELFPFFPVQIMPARTLLLYCSCYLLSNAMF